MNAQLAAALAVLPNYLSQHVLLSLSAMALGAGVSLPLALWAARRPGLRWPLLAATSLVQTIPALALLALFYPLLLALSGATQKLFGASTPALGFLPALLALALYAMLPIVRATISAIAGIDPAIIEAADAVGMTPAQRLWRVELPLAAPFIVGGLRTAMVWTIGAATLATPVGQVSLGNYIFSGLQTENWVFVLFGCAASVVVALAADQLLALVERDAERRDWKRALMGAGGFALAALATLAPAASFTRASYVIGAKNFSEQFILADLMALRLQAAGLQAEKREGLGSAVVFRALAAGDIDVYVDYSGTLWTGLMHRADNPPRAQMLADLGDWLKNNSGAAMLGALGFENNYAFAMKSARAQELGVATIADLARAAPQLTLGADLEFQSRPEWASVRDAYGLRFAAVKSYNPTFMYRALDDGQADVITAFSSDGRILSQNLVTLDDPKNAFPHYDAMILIAPKRAGDERLRAALQPLVGAIDLARMRRANLDVDRDANKLTPLQAAERLGKEAGVLK